MPESIPGMVDATWTAIYHDIVFIVLKIVTIVVVTILFTWQTQKHAAVQEALEAEALAGEW